MKKLIYLIILILSLAIYTGCNNDDSYNFNRPPAPAKLTATQGDTSVFLKWDKVPDAPYYVLVRGLAVIADSLATEVYEDAFAPDTLVEYRIYAKNAKGWRSSTYASAEGYSGLPKSILPRAPISMSASTANYEGCLLEWKGGRFAKTFSIYRGEELIAENVTGNSFTDYKASVTNEKEYRVFSVNVNGYSPTASKAVGKKAHYFLDTYEDLAIGSVIAPWTFRADRIAYYTEGNPEATSQMIYAGAKSLQLKSGKIQLLCDWGGTLKKGYYKIGLMVKRTGGGFWMISSANDIGGSEHLTNTEVWTLYEVSTGLIEAGVKFNLKVEPYGDGSTYIDNFGIEYLSPKAVE